jgi:hypothetical protein
MNNFIVALLTAFVTAIITWFGTNYFGRNLLRFWDLRLEVHKAIFVSDSTQVYKLAIKIEGLKVILPAPVFWYLRMRRYELQGAAQALIALSDALSRNDSSSDETLSRVKAQECLQLPIDPEDARHTKDLLDHCFSH